MRYGIEVIPFGEYADPWPVLELAQAADAAGWEAISIWDHMLIPFGAGDVWAMLAGVAGVTQRLKLVSAVAALPRYRPQNLARFLVGLDRLSRGRVVLGAGAGALDEEFTRFGLPGQARARAEMLDEALEVMTGLWTGQPVTFAGRHFSADGASLVPGPVQQPRIPIWIGGESRPALRRAARWDGWIMGCIDEQSQVTVPPERVARDVDYIRQHRETDAPFDVAVDGVTQPGENRLPREYAEAGATWWFESIFGLRGSHAEMLERVKAGPPR
jgi:alkanesulfonate monooxygenase SsuD/methylene tetrahydromethanopterin reductase-like flavin-dependent oxidoreductase (luciferase family)